MKFLLIVIPAILDVEWRAVMSHFEKGLTTAHFISNFWAKDFYLILSVKKFTKKSKICWTNRVSDYRLIGAPSNKIKISGQC
jgi:hypothetical protein